MNGTPCNRRISSGLVAAKVAAKGSVVQVAGIKSGAEPLELPMAKAVVVSAKDSVEILSGKGGKRKPLPVAVPVEKTPEARLISAIDRGHKRDDRPASTPATQFRSNVFKGIIPIAQPIEDPLGKATLYAGRNLFRYLKSDGTEVLSKDTMLSTKKEDYSGGTVGHSYNDIIKQLVRDSRTDAEVAKDILTVLKDSKSLDSKAVLQKYSQNDIAAAEKLIGIINHAEEARSPGMGKFGRGYLNAIANGEMTFSEVFKTTSSLEPSFLPAYSKVVGGGETAAVRTKGFVTSLRANVAKHKKPSKSALSDYQRKAALAMSSSSESDSEREFDDAAHVSPSLNKTRKKETDKTVADSKKTSRTLSEQ